MTGMRVASFGTPPTRPTIRTVSAPEVGRLGAAVSVIACALDQQDMRTLAGSPPGVALGRHAVGVIEELGSGMTEDDSLNRLRPGTPVLIPSVIRCGRCALCLDPTQGDGLCVQPHRMGTGLPFDPPAHPLAGLADRIHLDRAARPTLVVHALPLTVPLWLGTLIEPFAVCLRAFDRLKAAGGFAAGASVVVQGTTALGLVAVAAAVELGAGRVIVVGGPDQPQLRLARLFGAEATIDREELTDPAERIAVIQETVGGRGADVVLCCDPATESIAQAIAVVRERGAILDMTGAAPDPGALGLAWAGVMSRELLIVGASSDPRLDVPAAMRLLYRARSRYPFEVLHERFPFTEAGIADACAALSSGRIVRALVVPKPDLLG